MAPSTNGYHSQHCAELLHHTMIKNKLSLPCAEDQLSELRRLMNKSEGEPLCVVGIGVEAWGSIFMVMFWEAYGHVGDDKVQFRMWRRGGKAVEKSFVNCLFDAINSREDMLKRIICNCAYLKYVEARLGDQVLYAEEILRDEFYVNMLETPLCPIKVVTNS